MTTRDLLQGTWSRLSTEQKLELLLDQVEWAVFKITALDVSLDEYSIEAVITARRALIGNIFEANNIVKDLAEKVRKVFVEKGGDDEIVEYHGTALTECAVVAMCWYVLIDIEATRNPGDDIIDINDFGVVISNYLTPVRGMKSPFERWVAKTDVDYSVFL